MTEVARDNGANAVYKGLAQAQASDGKNYLYATNFRSGRVEVYNSDFSRPNCPAAGSRTAGFPGYAPFDIAEFAGKLYVTYAKQDAAREETWPGRPRIRGRLHQRR